jgi:uncharacterized protein
MLVRFRFSNFRCFRTEQELSLVAAPPRERKKLVRVEEHRIELHRTAAIFGANATGKSTVLAALHFLARTVVLSHQQWLPQGGTGVPAHALAKDEPSSFKITFLERETLYEYEVRLDETRVLFERLVASRGRRHLLFERDSERKEPFEFGKQLRGENRTIARLTRPNSLFVSAAAINNHPMLLSVFGWFFARLRVLWSHSLSREIKAMGESVGPQDWSDLVEFLRRADFEINALRKVKRRSSSEAHEGGVGFEFLHRQGHNEFWLPVEEESLGTQAWFAMGGSVLQCLRDGGILCVDELDSSLHPLLVRYLIDLFQDSRRNPKNAQLIFNTHDVSLLGDIPEDSPLDRDQVWITDRGAGGAPELIPLSDFHVRKQENLGRGYLLGRYGGIPRLPLGAA